MPKNVHLILLLIPFCISCNRYQYTTVSSHQLNKNIRNEFVFENDSLVLVYNFMGQDLGANIFIENKLPVPVYIDWTESALIINGHTNSYAPIQLDILGLGAGGGASPVIDFIPPRATLSKTPLVLHMGYDNTIPKWKFRKVEYTSAEGLSRIVKTASFGEADSPLRLRSFITYKVGSADSQPLSVEHSFYVSDVMSTVETPPNFLRNGDHGNQFYTSKATVAGGVGAGIAAGAIAGIIILLQKNKIDNGPY